MNLNNNNNKSADILSLDEKDMDKSGISSLRNNDVTRISELHKNQHGSMSSLYQ